MTKPKKYSRDAARIGIFDLSEETVWIRGVVVPASFTLWASHPDWPWIGSVYVRVAVHPEVGPVPVSIEARVDRSDHEPVSYRDADDVLARTFSLPELFRVWTATAAQSLALDRLGAEGDTSEDAARRREALVPIADAMEGVTYFRRRRIVTREHLRAVAATYRQAMTESRAPTVAVAEQFQVSHSTAARWVGAARTAGELGPARGKKPGERSAPAKKRSRREGA